MTSRPRLTEQQAAAISTKQVSIALSAGAGCGKTFVLTQRFLEGLEPRQAAEDPVDLHSLVAITFTERAAREMRDRIRAACHSRLQHCETDEVDHWLAILRGLDAARISTIHSFCTSLLRSQAVEAGFDPRFTVLEAALADTLLRRVVRDRLQELIEKRNDDAMQLVVLFGLERAQDLLRRLTTQRFQIDFAHFSPITPEQLALQWHQQWLTECVPTLVSKFRNSDVIDRVLQTIAGSPTRHETMKDRIAYLSSMLPPDLPWADNLKTLSLIHEAARVSGGGGKKDWESDERQAQIKLALETLREDVKALKEQLEIREEDIVPAAELACRALRLTELTAADYEAVKQAQGVLDFDDLLLHARNLLKNNADVRRRVAAGIRLLMVDEFQDTDPVQADIVRSLCGAALQHGKLFMVGDRKQSIYRFRRADPTVFVTMSNELPPQGRLPLSINFRSQPAILNFVNRLFAPAMEGYEPLIPFQSTQFSPTPAIEFLFASSDAAEFDAPPSALPPIDDDSRPNAGQIRAREADWMARRIVSLLDDPTPRIRTKDRAADGNPILRPTKPGDIVVLFRALTSVQAYEAAFERYGLEYYLVGGKAFFAQQEVFDLLNLCRYIDDCDDLVGLVGVLRSPFFNLSDDALQALAFHTDSNSVVGNSANDIAVSERVPAAMPRGPLTLHQTLYFEPPTFLPQEQQDRIRFAADVLRDLRATKDRIPLADLLTNAVQRTGYDAALLAEFLGSRKLANLHKLLDTARQFDQGQSFTLKDFVTRLQTSVLEETDEEFATTLAESGDTIRLMSIHQSKGLEFPVVIVADIDRKGPPRSGDAVLHPQLGALIRPPEKFGVRAENLAMKIHHLNEKAADADETIRLFYVACTRAADYLILSTGLDEERTKSHSPWLELIESRFDLQTGLLKGDPLLGSSRSATAARETIPDILVHHVPCEAKRPKSEQAKRIPLSQLAGNVIAAIPGEFPASARIFPRDRTDIPTISVSRLEAIDEELRGAKHAQRPKALPTGLDEEVDVDLATSLGMIVHAVLERVDFHNSCAWPELLQHSVDQLPENPGDDVVKQAHTMLTNFFDSPLAVEMASSKATHREIDFLLPWPSNTKMPGGSTKAAFPSQTLVAGIIDLLVETETGWHVLDYKTGQFPSLTPDQTLLAPYELQLGLYAYAVEQWFGVTPRELSLIVFRPQVRRVTLPWSSEQWEKIRARINRAIESVRSADFHS